MGALEGKLCHQRMWSAQLPDPSIPLKRLKGRYPLLHMLLRACVAAAAAAYIRCSAVSLSFTMAPQKSEMPSVGQRNFRARALLLAISGTLNDWIG